MSTDESLPASTWAQAFEYAYRSARVDFLLRKWVVRKHRSGTWIAWPTQRIQTGSRPYWWDEK